MIARDKANYIYRASKLKGHRFPPIYCKHNIDTIIIRHKCSHKKEDEKPDFITTYNCHFIAPTIRCGKKKTKNVLSVINRIIVIPNREIGRFSLLYETSGDLAPNRDTWKLCIISAELVHYPRSL